MGKLASTSPPLLSCTVPKCVPWATGAASFWGSSMVEVRGSAAFLGIKKRVGVL